MNLLKTRVDTLDNNSLNCEVVSKTDDFRGLKSEWNNLLAKSSATSFFLTYEYLWTWWNVYGADYQLRIVTARDVNGQLIGIAPMMIGRGDRKKRRLLRHLVFISGLGDTLAEDMDFIIAAGHERWVVSRFCNVLLERLGGEWDLMRLAMVCSESPSLEPLRSAVENTAAKLRCIHSHIAPYASLPTTWQGYLAGRSKSFRTGFGRRARKLDRDHRVEFLTAGREIAPREAIDIVAALCRERWGRECTAFSSEKFNKLHLKLAELLVPKKQAFLIVMKVDGLAASAGYDLIYGPKVFQFQGGWRKSLAGLAIGKVMLGKRIERAIKHGYKQYDFLVGGAEYKANWATGSRVFLDFEVANPSSFRGRLFGGMRQLRTRYDDAR